MSYDISIHAMRETQVFDTNYTYNVSGMFRKALGGDGINDLHGKKCKDCIKPLQDAVKHMEENPKEYEMLNPSNGWGNFAGAYKVMQELLQSCIENPAGKISIN